MPVCWLHCLVTAVASTELLGCFSSQDLVIIPGGPGWILQQCLYSHHGLSAGSTWCFRILLLQEGFAEQLDVSTSVGGKSLRHWDFLPQLSLSPSCHSFLVEMGLNQRPLSTSPVGCYKIIPHPESALSLLGAQHKVLEGERGALGPGQSLPHQSVGLC